MQKFGNVLPLCVFCFRHIFISIHIRKFGPEGHGDFSTCQNSDPNQFFSKMLVNFTPKRRPASNVAELRLTLWIWDKQKSSLTFWTQFSTKWKTLLAWDLHSPSSPEQGSGSQWSNGQYVRISPRRPRFESWSWQEKKDP